MTTPSRSPFRSDLLKEKVALITGGATGICNGIAREMCRHGARVMLMGRRREVLESACAALRADGFTAEYFCGDVRNEKDAAQSVARVIEAFGHLDILVNGAAGNFLCPTENLSPNGFRTVVEIDLIGTFNMSKAAFGAFNARKTGVILNISATLHYQGTLMQSHVMAAKAGIDALARNLACEWGPHGIRTITIAPGPIADTEGMRRLAPSGADRKIAREVPLQRLGSIDDIAWAALFLVSEAASYINGEVLVVDGGQWLVKPAFVPPESIPPRA